MRPSLTFCCLVLLGSLGYAEQKAGGQSLADEVNELVARLDADTAEQRSTAEAELTQQTENSPAEILPLLPPDGPRLPASIRSALARVRLAGERAIASRATAASNVTIQVAQAPLAEVIAAIEKQTGNRLHDGRGDFGGDLDRTVTLTVDDQPFWPAVDALLDAARLGVYPYGEDDALSLIDRPESQRPRVGRGAYAGPFRFEPLRVVSTAGLRDRGESTLRVDIEVAWEPRLRPIALSQPMQRLSLTTNDGMPIVPLNPNEGIDLEVSPGSQALEMSLSLQPPAGGAERIEKLRGTLTTLIPATRHVFRFEQIGEQEGKAEQSRGDASVTLERFVKQNAIWELHMRLKLNDAGDSLASHRGWVFRNASYLVDAEGRRIEHAGFETTLQTESELGLAYLFDLSENLAEGETALDPAELTWVYESPTGVYSVPVEYELGPIALP